MAPPTALLGVDGNSLGHRAFHARPEAQDDPAALTGAVVSMLARVWEHGPYRTVVIAFDHPTNRRRQIAPEYKAGRPPTPPALRDGLVAMREHLEACGLPVLEHPGGEADDQLAVLADAARAQDRRCDLLSSDRDLTAQVSATVRLLRPRTRFADLAVEDPAVVEATHGVPPARYLELAALRGDASDGLRGADGIGPKTAAKLLRSYGDLAELYRHLHELPPRTESALRSARARIERNLELMRPLPETPAPGAAMHRAIDPERVVSILGSIGQMPAGERLARAVARAPAGIPPRPPPPAAPSDDGAGGDPRPSTNRGVAAADGEQVALF